MDVHQVARAQHNVLLLLQPVYLQMLAGRPLFPGKNHHDQLWHILKCLGTMTERQLELLDRWAALRVGVGVCMCVCTCAWCEARLVSRASAGVFAPTRLNTHIVLRSPPVASCRDPQFACFRLPTASEIDPLESRLPGVSSAAMQVSGTRPRVWCCLCCHVRGGLQTKSGPASNGAVSLWLGR